VLRSKNANGTHAVLGDGEFGFPTVRYTFLPHLRRACFHGNNIDIYLPYPRALADDVLQELYPNVTYTTLGEPDDLDPNVNGTIANAYDDFPMNKSSALFLGPLQVNNTFARKLN
jgi:hypothetical protein